MTHKDDTKERERVAALYEMEDELKKSCGGHIGGVDEAGRGPLAGPVVAACCILEPDAYIEYLNDSKQLTEKRREKVFSEVLDHAVSIGVGLSDEREIDQSNILQATYLAMRRAIGSMRIKPDYLITDAVAIPGVDIGQESVVKADAKAACVAAASVIAKVTRDHIMKAYDEALPEYGFAKHKAYGTKAHYEAIEKYGILPIHRRTFLKKRIESGKLAASAREVELEKPQKLMEDFLRQYALFE